jgi:rhamnose utilization protein RhaD (predicted bifunctional aldolase and dehydrogenase)
MKSFWNDEEACAFARAFSGSGDVEAERLALRVYSSRLLGRDPSLVLHGGGNTSLKSKVAGLFGDVDDVAGISRRSRLAVFLL